ncbi:MAG: GC-type dockerin domain-anchored protein [Planctomycetota bacterium]
MMASRTVRAISLALAASPAGAQEFRWIGPAEGRWDTPAHWSPFGVPNAPAASARIGNPGDRVRVGAFFHVVGSAHIGLDSSVTLEPGQSLGILSTLTNDGLVRIRSGTPDRASWLYLPPGAEALGTGRIELDGEHATCGGASAKEHWILGGTQTIVGSGLIRGLDAWNGELHASDGDLLLRSRRTRFSGSLSVDDGSRLVIEETPIEIEAGSVLGTQTGNIVLRQAEVIGGKLGAGVLIDGAAAVVLQDTSVGSDLTVPAGSTLAVRGDVINHASIIIGANGGTTTAARLAPGVIKAPGGILAASLSGSGEVVLQSSDHAILDRGITSFLLNGPEHTIRGAGQIRATFVNRGAVIADRSGDSIRFGRDVGSGQSFRSPGLISCQPACGIEMLSVSFRLDLEGSGIIDIDGGTLSVRSNWNQFSGESEKGIFNGVIVLRNGAVGDFNSGIYRDIRFDISNDSNATFLWPAFVRTTISGPAAIERIRLGSLINHGRIHAVSVSYLDDRPAVGGTGELILGSPDDESHDRSHDQRGVSFLENGNGHTISGDIDGRSIINSGTLVVGFKDVPADASAAYRLEDAGTVVLDVRRDQESTDRIDIQQEGRIGGTLRLEFPDGVPEGHWARTVVTFDTDVTGQSFKHVDSQTPITVTTLDNAIRVGRSCLADMDLDLALDMDDILLLVSLFQSGMPEADLAEPFGELNFFDIALFLEAFGDGCEG